MSPHNVVSHEEWIEARRQHLAREKDLTRLRDRLAEERRALPWEKVAKPYVFDGPRGEESLADLFEGRHQLVVYHFMFEPGWDEGCKSCSFWIDNLDGVAVHLKHRDVGFVAITIDLDQQADPRLKVDQLDKLVTLGNARNVVGVGNVDVTIFERATKAEIYAEVKRCIDTVGKRSRFVLSTSCELPPQANPDCVRWFMESARDYGRYERILAP